MKIAISASIFFLVIALSSSGQDKFIVDQYNTEDGLPSNSINGIQWDEKNQFLWIATEAGICRYNGDVFKVFNRKPLAEELSPRMRFMARTFEGNIVTANKAFRIFMVKENDIEYRSEATSQNSKNNNGFLLKSSEKLWKSTTTLPEYFKKISTDIQVAPFRDTVCFLLAEDSLFRYSPARCTAIRNIRPRVGFRNIFKAGNSFFLRDAANQYYKLLPDAGTLEPAEIKYSGDIANADIKAGNFTIFWENGMEAPILISGGKAYQIRERNGTLFTDFLSESIPENTFIRNVQFSKELNTLFLSTNSKGLIVIRPRLFHSVRKITTGVTESTAYYGQTELPDGSILNNKGQVISLKNSNVKNARTFPKGFYSLFRTTPNDLYYIWDKPKAEGHVLGHFLLKEDKAEYFNVDFDYNCAIAGIRGKLYILNQNGLCTLESGRFDYLLKWSDPANIYYSLDEKEPGVLLMTTCRGLFQFNINSGRLDTLLTTGEFCIRTCRILGSDLLIGTYGKGMFLYNKGQLSPLPLDKNKYLQFAHCFLPDSLGFVWISTNRGIFRCLQSELTEAAKHGSNVFYQFFGKPDGLDMTELNGGCYPCAIRLKEGQFSFPSMDGYALFSPESATQPSEKFKLFIDELNIGSEIIVPDKNKMEYFSPTVNEVIVNLGYPAWHKQENVYIEYRLDNQEAWRMMRIENEKFIRLSNLSQGKYDLEIRMRKGFGKEKYAYQKLAFEIAAPWYRKYWAYGMGALLLWGLVYIFIQFKTRRQEQQKRKLEKEVLKKTKELRDKNEELEKRNTIKSRLISIISHDIITPLKFVTVAGRKLLENKKQMPEELQQETIEEMTETSRELQLLSTNILNWIKYVNENIRITKEIFSPHETAKKNTRLLESIAAKKKILIHIDIHPSIRILQFEEPVRILMYNLLLNAINFSDKGTITLAGSLAEKDFIFSVKDEGVGMNSEQIENILSDEFVISSINVYKRKGNGLGYLIIKDLLKMIQGTIYINSMVNNGTTITIRFPAV